MPFFEQYPGLFILAVALIAGASGWAGSWLRERNIARKVNRRLFGDDGD